MEELKPCPFCGAIPEYRKGFPSIRQYTVSCENEQCKIHPYALGHSKQETFDKWNYRTEN
ncbi:hypothetical protein DW097_15760 [Enterocloster clostridioformis]|uniref:Lar family restriction alleviation protein n=1 Tax=Enterocloster TaxID=2719313 RepID=UPI000E409FA7|nr:Lar family restriction alleviation protein [Enterocloster citroniae]RGB85466.1 hypothetical protein DW097_15760 [Enterocloster clostridioformis]RGC24643.1 hypothetical protein DWX59_19975 [Enterocloster aldenensis]DAP12335.1 MAG TPA: restriction alleviation protein [Caudoviricetes sp.]